MDQDQKRTTPKIVRFSLEMAPAGKEGPDTASISTGLEEDLAKLREELKADYPASGKLFDEASGIVSEKSKLAKSPRELMNLIVEAFTEKFDQADGEAIDFGIHFLTRARMSVPRSRNGTWEEARDAMFGEPYCP